MSKITNDCWTRSGTGCFIAVPYSNSRLRAAFDGNGKEPITKWRKFKNWRKPIVRELIYSRCSATLVPKGYIQSTWSLTRIGQLAPSAGPWPPEQYVRKTEPWRGVGGIVWLRRSQGMNRSNCFALLDVRLDSLPWLEVKKKVPVWAFPYPLLRTFLSLPPFPFLPSPPVPSPSLSHPIPSFPSLHFPYTTSPSFLSLSSPYKWAH